MWYALRVRVVVDYRPALRERTGVGEYVHQLVRAFAHQAPAPGDRVAAFTSSWKDRPLPGLAVELGATVIDRRVPAAMLNFLWHRWGWPPAELLCGAADIFHAAHPLLMPAHWGAQVITIHDLFFLNHPEQTAAEVRRDYAALAPRHARRADAIITPSRYTADLITATLGVPADRVHVCAPGPPVWSTLGHAPHVPSGGYILFIGTLEPRKNVGALLDAYERLLGRGTPVPDLVLAGRATATSEAWLARIGRAPLAGRVRHLGYVAGSAREALYAGARLVVLPSLDEGFGLPALEAMSAGVPVLLANRGALPEVAGDAGVLVDPANVDAFERALYDLVQDEAHATACAERGLRRAREFSWSTAATALRQAYVSAIARRRTR